MSKVTINPSFSNGTCGASVISMKGRASFFGNNLTLFGGTRNRPSELPSVAFDKTEAYKKEFSDLIIKHRSLISATVAKYVFYYGASHVDRSEIEQCVAISLYKTLNTTYNPLYLSLTSYIHRVCRDVSWAYIKHTRIQKTTYVDNVYKLDQLLFTTPDEYKASDIQIEELRLALDTAPEQIRQYFLLKLQGKSLPEIQEALGWSNTRARNAWPILKNWILANKHLIFSIVPELVVDDKQVAGREKRKLSIGSKRDIQKMPDEIIIEIKRLINAGEKNIIIANRFKVCPSLVSVIKRGIAYNGVGEPIKANIAQDKRLSPADKEKLKHLYKTYSSKEIAAMLGVTPPAISYQIKQLKKSAAL